jgi:DNA invertase Pin-like site-specific DNA recombinase
VTRLASVQGDVDLGSDYGQLLARVKGAIDFAEVAKIRRRVKRKMLERAEQGLQQSGYAGSATRRTRSP